MSNTCKSVCCVNVFSPKEGLVEHEPMVQTKPLISVLPVSKKVDGVTTKLINGVTAAFFMSMERCSCIRIGTKHDSDDGDSLPLIRELDEIHRKIRIENGESCNRRENKADGAGEGKGDVK
ncbi:unnamed protein product [Ilex paraguariensis]|uniref:Uncharacterized protein n=1 Tax=Ilex paraguariensis TaxID=185542 RepID=A0ABC8RKW0_9AQUA